MTAQRRDTTQLDEAIATLERAAAELAAGDPYFEARPLLVEGTGKVKSYRKSLSGTFGEYVRTNRELDSRRYNLSIQDLDWCVHQFRDPDCRTRVRPVQNLMLIEEKRFRAAPTFAQRDSLFVLDQALRAGSLVGRDGRPKERFDNHFRRRKSGHRRVLNLRGEVCTFRFAGCFAMVFDGSGPEAGRPLSWWRFGDEKGRRITTDQLDRILRFELHPETLRPVDYRSHHDTGITLPFPERETQYRHQR